MTLLMWVCDLAHEPNSGHLFTRTQVRRRSKAPISLEASVGRCKARSKSRAGVCDAKSVPRALMRMEHRPAQVVIDYSLMDGNP
jgi:hypothetical protein